MSACSAATFISYHSRFVFVNNFLTFYFLLSCAFGTHRSARDILPDVSTNVINNLQLFYKPFMQTFTQYSPCIRTGCINQPHGFIGSGSALTDCACFNYISEGIPQPEFRQPEFHRMKFALLFNHLRRNLELGQVCFLRKPGQIRRQVDGNTVHMMRQGKRSHRPSLRFRPFSCVISRVILKVPANTGSHASLLIPEFCYLFTIHIHHYLIRCGIRSDHYNQWTYYLYTPYVRGQ